MRNIVRLFSTILLLGIFSCKKNCDEPKVAENNKIIILNTTINKAASVRVGNFNADENVVLVRQSSNSCESSLNRSNNEVTYLYKPGTHFEGADEAILRVEKSKSGITTAIKLITIRINVSN